MNLLLRIRQLRDELSRLVASGRKLTDGEVLELSHDLDELVCQVMKRDNHTSKAVAVPGDAAS